MRFLFKTSYEQDIALVKHVGQRFWYGALLAALAARGLVCLLFFAISFTSIPRSGFACRARKVVSYWLPHHWVETCSTPFENARPGKAGRSVCTGRSGSEGSDITAPDDCRPGPF